MQKWSKWGFKSTRDLKSSLAFKSHRIILLGIRLSGGSLGLVIGKLECGLAII